MAPLRSGRRAAGRVCGLWTDTVIYSYMYSIRVIVSNKTVCMDVLEGTAANVVVSCRGRLASAGDDGTIKLWGSTSWACEVTVHNILIPAIAPGINGGVVAMQRCEVEVTPTYLRYVYVCRY